MTKFASWVHGAFEGMEVELLEYAEKHLLRSSDKHVRRASGSPNQRQHLTRADPTPPIPGDSGKPMRKR